VDAELAALATRQHGVVARSQLLALGLSGAAIERRLAGARLHRVHQGVYAVGHRRLTQRSWWMAATLATGGVLSHRSAAALWGIRRSDAVEVTAPGKRRRKGIRVHRAHIPPDERTVVDGIPTTGPHRTLLDAAAILRPHQLERAVNETHFAGLTDTISLDALMARYPRREGIPALRTVLAKRRTLLRSDGEAALLAHLDAHGLPRPLTNVTIEGYEVDCVWPERRLIVEVDGGGHRPYGDAARDRRLAAAGWRTRRVAELRGDLHRVLAAELGLDE